MQKSYIYILSILILLGLADAIFLTYEAYALTNVGCPVSPWINCLAVSTSEYSKIFGIPLAVYGLFYYLFMLITLNLKSNLAKSFYLLATTFGALFSIYLIFVQAVLIGVYCIYCLLSAVISFLVFGLSVSLMRKERDYFFIYLFEFGYKYILRPVLWKIDAVLVHESMTTFGALLSKSNWIKKTFNWLFAKKYKSLKTNIAGIKLENPIGLSAGFDYNADLVNISSDIGFGFQSVGTITNLSYEGNDHPQLGRLPKSLSLMVNKGYKNIGVDKIIEKLSVFKKFNQVVGISIGRSNDKDVDTIDASIKDIITSFKKILKSNIQFSYFELNISCPNITNAKNVNFYLPKSLDLLLSSIDKLKLKKPLFIKMPIDKTNAQYSKMLSVIARHKVDGLIIGNLQTNKRHSQLLRSEVSKFKKGNFSGRPTFEDSNRLIAYTYQKYGDRFVIIGVGGIFNLDDIITKIKLGADAVQLITGMVFEGPQLIAKLNKDLDYYIRENNLKNISQLKGNKGIIV